MDEKRDQGNVGRAQKTNSRKNLPERLTDKRGSDQAKSYRAKEVIPDAVAGRVGHSSNDRHGRYGGGRDDGWEPLREERVN